MEENELSLASIQAEEENFCGDAKHFFLNGYSLAMSDGNLTEASTSGLNEVEIRAFVSGFLSAYKTKKTPKEPLKFLQTRTQAFAMLFNGSFNASRSAGGYFEFHTQLNQHGSWLYWNEEIKLQEDFHALFPNERLIIRSGEAE